MKTRVSQFIVGLFIIIAFLAMVFLAFRVSDISGVGSRHYYHISAEFDNIGGLKVRAPVSISGVRIGDVSDIQLDNNNFRAVVTLRISDRYKNLPLDTSANIFTQGILGSNYVSLAPGFDEASLKNGGRIETTHPAIVLENLIGQLIYNSKSDSEDESKTKAKAKEQAHAA